MVDPSSKRPRPAPPRVSPPTAPSNRPTRSAPPRPEFAVAPLRKQEEPAFVPTVLFALAMAAWVAVFLLTVAMAVAIYSDFDAVRTSLETGLSRQNPDSSATRVADTIRITLYGSEAIAVVLLVAAASGLWLLNKVRGAGRVVLIIAGIAGTASSVTFWTLMSDATPPILHWGPLAAAMACAVGIVVALFAAPRS